MALEIKQASSHDVPAAAAVMAEAAQWLIDRGTPLWSLDDVSSAKLEPHAEAGTLFVAMAGDEVAGTLIFQWADPVFWPNFPENEAGYIHRLAVRRRYSGQSQGVAANMLNWAERQVQQAHRQFLRLDASANHPGLLRYYEANGFSRHSTAVIGPYEVVRFEKPITRD